MFASQLLRILQTIPTDVNYETCAFDTPKPKLTMTENQFGIKCDSNIYEREADSLAFSASDPLHANGPGGSPNSLAQDGHEFWMTAVPKLSSVLDNSSKSNGNEPGGSPTMGDQDIPSHLNGFEKDAESFLFDTTDGNESQVTQEAVHFMIDGKSANCEKDSKDSETSTTVPQVFESDRNPFTDKNVVECELPEFMICYRENNIQIVRDICVDEGVPADSEVLAESDKDDHAGSCVLQPSNEGRHSGITEGGPDCKFFIPDEFKASSPEDISHDSAKEFGTGKIDETRTADDGSEEESSISSAHASEESILQDVILESSKCDKPTVAQKPDEIPSIEAILESLAVAFTSEEPKKDCPDSNLCYNSKVEGGEITFDFNSSKPAIASSIEELPPGKAGDTEDEKRNDHKVLVAVQLANNEEKIKENDSDPNPLRRDSSNNENGNSGNLSAFSCLQRGEGETSFSTSGPDSGGLITYSGPIAYSGSVSLRSDSSTTSTRSFAFPILQNEWNSSPVRMERADRRHFRKQRGWRHGLFCCRF